MQPLPTITIAALMILCGSTALVYEGKIVKLREDYDAQIAELNDRRPMRSTAPDGVNTYTDADVALLEADWEKVVEMTKEDADLKIKSALSAYEVKEAQNRDTIARLGEKLKSATEEVARYRQTYANMKTEMDQIRQSVFGGTPPPQTDTPPSNYPTPIEDLPKPPRD